MAITGATAKKFHPVSSGNYRVRVTVNNCQSPISEAVVYHTTGLMAKQAGGFTVMLSPNPAVSDARLIITGAKNKVLITLTDLAGRKVWQSSGIGKSMLVIPLQGVATGTYMVTVFDGVFTRSLMLVKAR